MNPRFLGEYAACKYSRGDQILTPLIVIASPCEPSVANQALAGIRHHAKYWCIYDEAISFRLPLPFWSIARRT
jgi:hypothetical protein